MKTEYLQRQLDILSGDALNRKIVIVGAGAIGSFTALTLAKMGFENITVWDDDEVDEVNLNCQFYPIESIGKPKVMALTETVQAFTGVDIRWIKERFTDDNLLRSDIVISAVDSMEARKTIFEHTTSGWFIDARMAAEYFSMFTVNLNDANAVKNYHASLYTDEEAIQERCTAKSTMYTVNMIAGFIGKAVKDIATDKRPISKLDFNVEENGAVWFTDGTKGTM